MVMMNGVAVALVLTSLLSAAIGQPSHLLSNVSTDCPPSFPPTKVGSTAIFCVHKAGCCNFTSVQAAVDAAPDDSQRSIVWILGIFVEKVVVKKPNITFQGQGLNVSMIIWNDTATTAGDTFNSASVHIDAPGFVAKNMSFKNAAPAPKPGVEGGQAVALRVSGDQAAFWGCGFFGDGANMAGRVPYARKLDKLEAEPFLTTAYIDGSEWLKPFSVF